MSVVSVSNSKFFENPLIAVNYSLVSRRTTPYRYGFNGMEKDDEVSGGGNAYTTEFREYDPRIGRWFSIDPLFSKFADESPYVAFHNNPISNSDPRGDAPGDGDKRAAKAKEIDKTDTRKYGQNRHGDWKNDKQVDCAEFAKEVQASTGVIIRENDCKTAANQIQKEGTLSFDLKDAKLGDQIFFTSKTESKTNLDKYVHTAIISGITKDGTIYITHATCSGDKVNGYSIITQAINKNGTIPYWDNDIFASVGRIDGKSETVIAKTNSSNTGATALTALSNGMKQSQQPPPPKTTTTQPASNGIDYKKLGVPENPTAADVDKFFGD